MNATRNTALLLGLALLGACAKGENAGNASDSTARNLTLAPADSSTTMRDMPATPPPAPAVTAPAARPPAARPKPPAPPASLTLAAGAHFDMAATDTITSRTAKAGDAFTATLLVGLLAREPPERHKAGRTWGTEGEELLKLAELAVRQSVHRVDHDRLDARQPAAIRLGPHHPVHDRNDVGQALPRPSTGGQDVAAARPGDLDRLTLMAVQPERRAFSAARLVFQAEDPLAVRVQQARRDQFRDRPTRGKVRVQGDPRVRPLVTRLHPLLDVRADARVVDIDEAARVLAVVVNELVTDPKDVHLASYQDTNRSF